ncbi:MAG: kelch repeat-containing protein, partial [Planctomycetota bacterium]|nr:kelch repeat-containing protein [Planctomycetota bacterium]
MKTIKNRSYAYQGLLQIAGFLAIFPNVLLVQAANPENSFPNIPEPVTSFGAAVHRGKVYYYGGHFGQAHRYSSADQANSLWELDLKTKHWSKLSQGDRLQGLAL